MNDSDDIQQLAVALSEQRESRGRKKIYKELADQHKTEELSADLRKKTQMLVDATARPTVDFNSLPDVKKRTERYFKACEESGTIPSVMSLSNYGFGVSRRTLNYFLKTHPESASAKYLEVVKDVIADVLSTAALRKNCDSIMAIFMLKNCHEFVDTVQIEPVQQPVLGAPMTVEEIQAKYQDLIED